jgi:hypothetical protein
MVAWVVKDFGGEIPRRDPRLLPNDMAFHALNVDLHNGALSGLPQPELIVDLTGSAAWPVRKAYRVPGPTSSDPDVWMPLPSEFSSVVKSPLTNDTLHRYYWTNPQGQPAAGVWWATYAMLAAGTPPYNLGFIAPDPSVALTVTVAGGSIPAQIPSGASIVAPGAGYHPNTTLTLVGGTLVSGQPAGQFTIVSTTGTSFEIAAFGYGGTDGPATLYGTTGDGGLQLGCTISGGSLYSIDTILQPGVYTANPTNPHNEPVIGAGLVGAAIYMDMIPYELEGANASMYETPPDNPVATTSSGSGSGCTLNVSYAPNGAPPLISRSYVFTYIDAYGSESSPCGPSATVDGPGDGTWTITGFPASAPGSPSGLNYAPVSHMRLYRTVSGTAGPANFFFVADLPLGTLSYIDTSSDTAIVNNNTLTTASFTPPLANMDGLISYPGGMLLGFTDNTIHFSQPNLPHAWPAVYDISVTYDIVGLAIWQQAVVALTKGFPSQGSGTTPDTFYFSSINVPEPCIARGSIITDLAGVYYASQNGLVMLNYFGMQNQTLSNLTKNIWLTEFKAANIIACRHRTQYLALNGTGMGFIIDYAEARMGIIFITPLIDAVSVWNDVYNGTTYMMADQKVWEWDSPDTPPLTYRWRSKEFYQPAPISLGACQISLEVPRSPAPPTSVLPPPPTQPSGLALPPGVNAVFRLYFGTAGANLLCEQNIIQARALFRIPSGLKAFNWQFEIVSNVEIHSVELASTMRELKKV